MSALAYPLKEAAEMAGTSVPVLRRLIAKGDLTAKWIGTKPVILHEELSDWLAHLPSVSPSK